MEKIKILVACHKPGPVYHDEVYTPIHVGRANSKFKAEMADMIGDDSGDNISEKNPYYCELTAQYWAWKNLQDVEYVGFCHYRRYFDFPITTDNVDSLFHNCDVIIPGCKGINIVEKELVHYVSIEDVCIFLMILRKKYPEYEKTVIDYMWNIDYYQKNMLVCKKKLFDEYAEWIFSILLDCEKYMRLSGYSRGRRALAYLGEFFMSVYFLHNHYQIKKGGVVSYVGDEKENKKKKRIVEFLKECRFIMERHFTNKPSTIDHINYMNDVLVGFKNDGILIK